MLWIIFLAALGIREIYALFDKDVSYVPFRAAGYLIVGVAAAVLVIAAGTLIGAAISFGAAIRCVASFWRWNTSDE